MKISFVGLGKLGLPLATTFAKNGHQVLAIDKNGELIQQLQENQPVWYENGLDENLALAGRNNIQYTMEYDRVHATDASIVLVNTPSNKKDGSFSNAYVELALIDIAKNLKQHNKKGHLFVLSSTVMPTSINHTLVPIIENITGWKVNEDFGFCYVPDFVALGQVIKDFENPDFILVGQSNEMYGKRTAELYSTIVKNQAPTHQLSLAEAEMCKVALNAYITTKISFANYLGLLCKKVDPTINVDNVTKVVGSDRRIGSAYFKSGASYGGTCFPRDTWAFMKVSDRVSLTAHQMLANEKINNMVDETVFLEIAKARVHRVGLVGLGFKPGTAVATEGLAAKLYNMMKQYDYKFYVHDHLKDAFASFCTETGASKSVEWCESLEELNANVDLVVLCTNDSYSIGSITKSTINPWNLAK